MKLPRWYWLVGYAGIAAPILLLRLLPLGLRLISQEPPPPGGIDLPVILGAMLFIAGCLSGTSILWIGWVCPYLEATDRVLQPPLKPDKRILACQILIAMPVTVIALIGLVFAIVFPVHWKIAEGVWELDGLVSIGVIMLLIACPVAAFTYWWARKVSVLYKQKLNAKLCVNCGYDLRASPGPACPECGEVIRQSSETARH